MYKIKIELDSSEIETLVSLLELAIENVGHPCVKKTETDKAEIEYLELLKEKINKV